MSSQPSQYRSQSGEAQRTEQRALCPSQFLVSASDSHEDASHDDLLRKSSYQEDENDFSEHSQEC